MPTLLYLYLSIQQTTITSTVDSRYYELWYNDIPLIMVLFQYHSHYSLEALHQNRGVGALS